MRLDVGPTSHIKRQLLPHYVTNVPVPVAVCEAHPQQQSRSEAKLGHHHISWGPDQQDPWPSTFGAELEMSTHIVGLRQGLKTP